MLHDIIEAYADALYVATTLRPPVSASTVRKSERFAEREDRSGSRFSGWLAGWLATRLGHRFGATAAPTASIRSFSVRPRHS